MRTILVETKGGGPGEATVHHSYGGLAVTSTPGSRSPRPDCVTHVSSGRSLGCGFKLVGDAQAWAAQLQQLGGSWDRDLQELRADTSFMERFRAARAAGPKSVRPALDGFFAPWGGTSRAPAAFGGLFGTGR